MKKDKRISVNAFEQAAKEYIPNETSFNWNSLDVVVRPLLPLSDMLEFVNGVVESCFSEKGEYIPEAKWLAINSNILTYYTNITLPKNLTNRYELLYSTNIVDLVLELVEKAQYHEILEAIDEKIEHRKNSDIYALREKLKELVIVFAAMQKQSEQMFKGLDAEDVSRVLGAVAENGKVDEAKIVEAYLAHDKKLS